MARERNTRRKSSSSRAEVKQAAYSALLRADLWLFFASEAARKACLPSMASDIETTRKAIARRLASLQDVAYTQMENSVKLYVD